MTEFSYKHTGWIFRFVIKIHVKGSSIDWWVAVTELPLQDRGTAAANGTGADFSESQSLCKEPSLHLTSGCRKVLVEQQSQRRERIQPQPHRKALRGRVALGCDSRGRELEFTKLPVCPCWEIPAQGLCLGAEGRGRKEEHAGSRRKSQESARVGPQHFSAACAWTSQLCPTPNSYCTNPSCATGWRCLSTPRVSR